MNRITLFFVSVFVAFSFVSCGDFLEEDISNKAVKLLSPANGYVSKNQTLMFRWDTLEGATSYRFQIVRPSFDSIAEFVVEEVLENENRIQVTLPVGSYQWTVIAENSAYAAKNSMVFDLFMENDSMANLSGSILVLMEPASNAETTNQTIRFEWSPMSNADSYNFQLASPDFSNNAFLLANDLVEDVSITKTLGEGIYRWRVRGQNNSSVSTFTERKLTIDITPPNQAQLTAPPNEATVSLPVLLAWNPDPNSLRDTLYVYKDSLGASPVLTWPTTDGNYSFNISTFNKYFWRVRSVDGAGNTSTFSETRKLLIQ